MTLSCRGTFTVSVGGSPAGTRRQTRSYSRRGAGIIQSFVGFVGGVAEWRVCVFTDPTGRERNQRRPNNQQHVSAAAAACEQKIRTSGRTCAAPEGLLTLQVQQREQNTGEEVTGPTGLFNKRGETWTPLRNVQIRSLKVQSIRVQEDLSSFNWLLLTWPGEAHQEQQLISRGRTSSLTLDRLFLSRPSAPPHPQQSSDLQTELHLYCQTAAGGPSSTNEAER